MSVKQRITLILLVSFLLILPVRAADTSSGSIKVVFVPDVRFRIYQVATASDGAYSPAPPFSDISLPPKNAPAEAWRELTIRLSEYAETGEALPLQTAATAEDGQAVFGELPPGLYLLTADPFYFGGQLCISAACIVPLHRGEALAVYPKYSAFPEDGPGTGDAAMPEIWVSSMFISALGLLVLWKKKGKFQLRS